MTNSRAFQEFKRLYYEEHLSIKTASITDGTGRIVFEDSEDGSETRVTGDTDDFIHAIWGIKNTVRDGEDELIDVTATPAGSIEQYYDNMEYFLPSESMNSPEDEMNRVMGEILTGQQELLDADLRTALDAAVTRDMEHPDLQKVIQDYYAARASQLIYLKGFSELFESLPNDVIYDYDRFMQAYSDIEEILREKYLLKPAERAYSSYRDRCNADIEYLTQQLLGDRNLSKQEWRALLMTDGDREEDKDGETIEIIDREYLGEDEIPEHAHGKIDGEIAARRILKEYAYYYEASETLFRDLVATVQGKDGDVRLDRTQQVMTWLKENDDLQWTWAVSPEFRNSASHLGIEINNETGLVRLYDKKDRDRETVRELPYSELREEYYGFVDVVMAVMWGFTLTDQLIKFEYLRSQDFMFTVIENLPPETL